MDPWEPGDKALCAATFISVTISSLISLPVFSFFSFLSVPHSMKNLLSPSRDQTQASDSGGSESSHWTTREALEFLIFLNFHLLS